MSNPIPADQESVTTRVWRIVKTYSRTAEFTSVDITVSDPSLKDLQGISAALSTIARRGVIKAVGKTGKHIHWKLTAKGAKLKVKPTRKPARRKKSDVIPPVVAEELQFAPGNTLRFKGEPGTYKVTDVGTMEGGKIHWQKPIVPAPQMPLVDRLSGTPSGVIAQILTLLGELEVMAINPLSQFSTSDLLAELTRRTS